MKTSSSSWWKLIGLVVVIVGVLIVSGCYDDDALLKRITENRSSDVIIEIKAPACDGKGGITGCLGKSVIKDIIVEPAVDCLNVDANNCNGGILGIDNKCDMDFIIGGKTIHANSYKGIEFVRNKEGKIIVIEPAGNVDSYNPKDEDLLSVKGRLGEQDITMSYVKKNVCGTAKIPDILGV